MLHESAEILLVEDDPAHAAVIERAVRARRPTATLRVVTSAREAIDYLMCDGAYVSRTRSSDPKLVMVDLEHSVPEGLEVVRRLKSSPRAKRIPIVFLTNRGAEEALELYGLGANSHIVKPEPGALEEAARSITDYWLGLNEPPVYVPDPD